MARIPCPTCRQEFDSDKSPAMPFCSQRCRLIDLGRWMKEEYSLPVERNPELQAYEREEDSED